jgi:cold-inducible RNA-binding protein
MEFFVNIFIGNMSFETTEAQLRTAFEGYGAVSTVKIISDRETGRPKGFAFVEMPAMGEASAAISGLNGQEMDGRSLNVNQAKPREDNGSRGVSNDYRKAY